jgi:hypothetical protein
MTEIHKYIRLIIAGAVLLLFAWIMAPALNPGVTHIHNHIYPDTSKHKEAYKAPQVIANNTPVKVDIYLKTDTALRNKTVAGPVVVSEDLKGNILKITTVGDSGHVKTETHKLDPDDKSVKVNSRGEVEEKKRTNMGIAIRKVGKRIKQVGEAVAIVYTIYKILKGKL